MINVTLRIIYWVFKRYSRILLDKNLISYVFYFLFFNLFEQLEQKKMFISVLTTIKFHLLIYISQ